MNVNTIITNIYIAPAKGLLAYSKVVKLVDNAVQLNLDRPDYVKSDIFSTDTELLYIDAVRYITYLWFINNFNIRVDMLSIFDSWEAVPGFYNMAEYTMSQLDESLGNIPTHRHGRHIRLDTYIVGDNLHVLLRSCNEFN